MRSTEMAYERLRSNLDKLKLPAIGDVLDGVLEVALKEKWSAVEIIDELFERERTRKEESSRKTRLQLSGFPMLKQLEDFDYEFQPSVPEELIRDLRTLRFIHNKENVILQGPPGVGKTHLAIGLGIEAINAGMTVYFVSAATLIDKLKKATLRGNLDRQLKMYCKYNLLIIDELGYLPLGKEGSHLLFQVISKLYEERSVIITSNKAFGEWGEVFDDYVAATAIVDRLLHHSTVIKIHGDSYRQKERKMFHNPLRREEQEQ